MLFTSLHTRNITLTAVIGLLMLLLADSMSAQDYELSVEQRRRYDQIHVEIWAKSLKESSSPIGFASLIVKYDNASLRPATVQAPAETDTLNRNLNQTNPIDTVRSAFHSANNYKSLALQTYGSQYYGLELTLASLGAKAIVPSTAGKGTFVGKMIFDIIGDPDEDALTGIEWSKSILPGDIQVFDNDSSSIESAVTFIDPGDFHVVGITVLSPNLENQVLDRDQSYAALSSKYTAGGYPIYFERTVNPNDYKAPIDEDLGYKFEYSLDDGNVWTEFGRVAETALTSSTAGDDARYISGEIFNADDGNAHTITSQNGKQLHQSNYRLPVRIVWAKDPFFTNRSEQARLRVTKLAGSISSKIADRPISSVFDINDYPIVLGRLFFLQLDGATQYLKTKENYSNATQITVEAWVNLNAQNLAVGDGELIETGIIASSGGPEASPILGSKEGSWMLYLHEGKLPAFRVREIQGRGAGGYIATLIAYPKDSLSVADDSAPLTEEHADNWTHLAATVENNVVSLYINGELERRIVNNDATDIRMLTSIHPIWIGVNPNNSIEQSDYLRAGIKSVKVWRNALTQQEIRKNAAGVSNPATIGKNDDLRKGLELYYSFEGILDDLANETKFQNSYDTLNYHANEEINNKAVNYRPDRPHIILTSPSKGVGFTNLAGESYPIRWLYYGYGDVNTQGTNPLNIEYSINDGENWHAAKNPDAEPLSGTTSIQSLEAIWEPYQNNDAGGNLRTINPYSREALLRVSESTSGGDLALTDVAGPFWVAPYFALQSLGNSIMEIPGSDALNITGEKFFFETWFRPYRFPSDEERFFTIMEKIDTESYDIQYGLRLLPSGQLQFVAADANKVLRSAISDANFPIERPNSISTDSVWTHVAVFIDTKGGKGLSEIRFFIDGVPQREEFISDQLGEGLILNSSSRHPLLIGYRAAFGGSVAMQEAEVDPVTGERQFAINNVNIDQSELGFPGEIREMRFWSGSPNNTESAGAEPTEMTKFIQGAINISAEDLAPQYRKNLFASLSLNGGNLQANGYSSAIGSETNADIAARFYNGHIEYVPVNPYVKLVTPAFRERIANTRKDVKVRWVGFEYDSTGFFVGTPSQAPSLEFSIRGGGGDLVQPYQFLGSKYWTGNDKNSISLPSSLDYRFKGTSSDVIYAMNVDASIADPDENNDGNFADQGPLSASLTNARLRLTANSTINSQVIKMQSEGPLFTVTPASNFTVRLLLEGYHDGDLNGALMRNLGQSFEEGGLRISLYRDNSGGLGELAGEAESIEGYDDMNPLNRDGGNRRFANVNFVFTELTDDNYWVVVEHPNHLPVMSRFAAPFYYTGDERTTWQIESGWDFQTWDGVDNNVLTARTEDPYEEALYTAFGDATSTATVAAYSTTGLIFNNGVAGGVLNAMPAMVGGDVDQSGQIDAADRVRVRLDVGTSLVRSDVTGNGIVNADDRTIADRNFGKVSSIYDVNFPKEETEAIKTLKESELAQYFIRNANNGDKSKSKARHIEIIQAGAKYDVFAEPEIIANKVKLRFYIKNTGGEFGLANATFAVKYNSDNLNFAGYTREDTVIFSDKPELGYVESYSGPRAGSEEVLPDVRTVEIDYDANAMLEGLTVPSEKTYLGTLNFMIADMNSKVSFAWHFGTSVHSIDGRVVTKDGTFHPIEGALMYDATITAPNGAERLAQLKPYLIKWLPDGNAPIYVEYSINGGSDWIRINAEPIELSSGKLIWNTPAALSTVCLVRIIDAESGQEIDRSDAYFSIQPSFAQIIRPQSGDALYHGGAAEEIWWFAQGYSEVKFEFSSDLGESWQSIKGTHNAMDGSAGWRVPKVTTKRALVRMLDADSGQEIAVSGAFRILDGQIVLHTPRFGETLFAGKTTRIRWTSKDVNKFDLYLSRDGGSSWEELKSDISGLGTYWNWLVTAPASKLGVIKAIWNDDHEMEYARTDIFSIENLLKVNDLPIGTFISEIYPNPTKSTARIDFNLASPAALSATLINSLGEVIYSREYSAFGSGQNFFEINLNDLPQGIYFFTLESDKMRVTKKLSLIR